MCVVVCGVCILSYSIALYTIFIAYTPRSSGEAPARRRAAARRRRGAGYRGGAPEGWARGAGGLGLEARAPEWRGGGGRGLEAQGSRAQKAEGWSRCIKAQIQHGSTQRSRARHGATQQATKQTRHMTTQLTIKSELLQQQPRDISRSIRLEKLCRIG